MCIVLCIAVQFQIYLGYNLGPEISGLRQWIGWMLQPDTLNIIKSSVFVVKFGLFGDWRPG